VDRTGQCLARAVNRRWECLPASAGWSVRSFVFGTAGRRVPRRGPPDPLYIDPAAAVPLTLAGERVADRHVMGVALGPDGAMWFATTAGCSGSPARRPAAPSA